MGVYVISLYELILNSYVVESLSDFSSTYEGVLKQIPNDKSKY